MKKVHIALGIPADYRKWRWLLSHFLREKGGLPPHEENMMIKGEVFAHLIITMEPVASGGGRKRFSLPA